MNYINRPKPAYTQEERIKYLEESIRELRIEKDRIRKEKGELRQKLLKMQKYQDELIRVKENKELLEENKKLKEELEEVKNDLEHRDSFFSIMRDVLANETITNNEIAMIVYCVVHEECGDYDLSEKELEVVKKFWNREYV